MAISRGDFWSFIYSTTNAKWRKQHLDICFQTYHEEISKYHKYSTLLEFIEEFHFKRRYGISFGLLLLFINNQDVKPKSLKKSKKVQNQTIKTLKKLESAENSSLRQNIMEIIREANQLKIMWMFDLPQKSPKITRNLSSALKLHGINSRIWSWNKNWSREVFRSFLRGKYIRPKNIKY